MYGKLVIVGLILGGLAVVMTMAGRGGGNFYVLVLVLSGMPMHEAAATGQFILFMTAMAALFVFQKHKVVVWPLAVFIGMLTALAALAGGYCSHGFTSFSLKLIFSGLLVIAGGLMLFPVSERQAVNKPPTFGAWTCTAGGEQYRVNLLVAAPVTLLTGFGAGMVGVSGGSFLVPLMVLACGVPVRIAVGTASTLVATTALMGLIGHALQGDFRPNWAVPLAIVTILGGFLGGRFAVQTRSQHLKQLFAYTTLAAALFMLANAVYSNQG